MREGKRIPRQQDTMLNHHNRLSNIKQQTATVDQACRTDFLLCRPALIFNLASLVLTRYPKLFQHFLHLNFSTYSRK